MSGNCPGGKTIDDIARSKNFNQLKGTERIALRDDEGDLKAVIPWGDLINTGLPKIPDPHFRFWNRPYSGAVTNAYFSDVWKSNNASTTVTRNDNGTVPEDNDEVSRRDPHHQVFGKLVEWIILVQERKSRQCHKREESRP